MTEKENVLHALRHDGKAEWIANITDSVRFFTVPQSRDKVKGRAEHLLTRCGDDGVRLGMDRAAELIALAARRMSRIYAGCCIPLVEAT